MPRFGRHKLSSILRIAAIALAISVVGIACSQKAAEPLRAHQAASVPQLQVDPFWPKPLPNNWIIGQVSGGAGPGYEWPNVEHGIYVDDNDFVWTTGSGPKDSQILKFTLDAKFVLQIGKSGQSKGSNDTANLGSPADLLVDSAAHRPHDVDHRPGADHDRMPLRQVARAGGDPAGAWAW